jgi:aspartate/methionine/tyrosine aminotransferase
MSLRPFGLERYFARHEFTARHLLCASDCESLSIAELLALEEGVAERFLALGLGYTESLGHPALRDAVAGLYHSLGPADVLVHAGAEEAIFNFMHVALAPGDHAVVHTPCYQSLAEVARARGARVDAWEADPRQGWELHLEDLTRRLTPHTKVVVVNFPHNPTGFLPSTGFLRELADLAERRGFMVFADEVYRGLEQDPARRLPAFADLHAPSVSLGVMSKTYGLAGLRIGWIATRNARLLQRMAAFKDYTTICCSAPSEFLATLALRHGEKLAARNREIIRGNLRLLEDFFARRSDWFDWQPPAAGPIAFPLLRRGKVARFCRNLVRQAGVLLLPGTLFAPGSNRFRIGFGRRSLPQALAALDAYLEAQT